MLSDLKYALRQFRKQPGFTLVAVLTLALGIGANTAVFSLVHATLLQALPVKDPGQLVLLTWDSKHWPPNTGSTGGDSRFRFSYPAFERLRQVKPGLASLFAYVPLGFTPQNATVVVDGEPTLANGTMVTGEFFSGLGVRPLLGRALNEQDEDQAAPRAAVISYDYWGRQFQKDPAVIGRSIMINQVAFTIVGVGPAGFRGVPTGGGVPVATDLWVAFDDLPTLRPWGISRSKADSIYRAKRWFCLDVMGRIDPSVGRAAAQAQLDAAFNGFLTERWKPAQPGQVPHLRLVDGGSNLASINDLLSTPLTMLMGAVGMVLLVACANLAILLLARANGRRQEVGIRLAVGASRARIVRQLLTESVLLSSLGGALGLFAGWVGIGLLMKVVSAGWQDSMIFEVRIDRAVLLFTGGASVLTGLVFGIAPAFRVAQTDLMSAAKASAGGGSEGRRGRLLERSLIVAQVAASVALMIAAFLFVRTLQEMRKRDLGFNPARLLQFGVDPTRQGYRGDRLMALYGQLRRDLLALPGVAGATLYQYQPFAGSNNTTFSIEHSDLKVGNDNARWCTVGPDFCKTMQIPLVEGRDILESDGPQAPKVGLVNEEFVRRFLGNKNPLGRRFFGPSDGSESFEIVGVIKDVELMDIHAKVMPKAFVPYAQLPGNLNGLYLEVRSAGNPAALAADLRRAVRHVDPNLPIMYLSQESEALNIAMLQERVFAHLASFVGVSVLLLACIGLYGTLAYSVARRTQEIGVRMALGATPRHVVTMVLRHGFGLVAAGILIGSGLGAGIARLVGGMLYGVAPGDPAAFAAAALAMALVGLLASWLPARRASRVDPVVALRAE